MKEVLIRTEGLCKSFSAQGKMEHVLTNVDLELYRGDFTVIMGVSGAGKSTLLYALAGMDKPTLGTILFSGVRISDFTPDELAVFRRNHCGFVFQQNQLVNSMNVLDNVLCSALLLPWEKNALMDKCSQLFADVDLSAEIWNKFPPQLSGGEAQRVGIVRALVNDPELLFADEPTGALNSKAALAVLDTLSQFHSHGQSIAMVTHDVRTALRGNRILYLRDGSVIGEQDLGPYNREDRTRSQRLTAFLGEMGW